MRESLTRFIFPWSSWHFITHIVSNTLWCMFRSFDDKSTRQVGTNNSMDRQQEKTAWIFMNEANRLALNGISSRTWLWCCCVGWIRDGARLMLNLIIVNVNKLFDFLTWKSSQILMHNAVFLFAVPASPGIQVFNCSDERLINNAKILRKTQLSWRNNCTVLHSSRASTETTHILQPKTTRSFVMWLSLCKCHEILGSRLAAIS